MNFGDIIRAKEYVLFADLCNIPFIKECYTGSCASPTQERCCNDGVSSSLDFFIKRKDRSLNLLIWEG